MLTVLNRLVLAIGLSLALMAPAAAGSYERGYIAYEKGDYATALKPWKPLADHGNAYAQVNLGLMYANGRGVPQDYAEAVRWYRLAADQGNAMAQFNLGVCLAIPSNPLWPSPFSMLRSRAATTYLSPTDPQRSTASSSLIHATSRNSRTGLTATR